MSFSIRSSLVQDHLETFLAQAVLRLFLHAVWTTLRDASPGAGPGAQIGALSFLHRFGSEPLAVPTLPPKTAPHTDKGV